MHSAFTILGTVAESLNLQTSAKGNHWANIVLTVERRYKDKDGAWQEDAVTVSLPVFGKRAEWLAKSTSEGDRVFVTGRIGGESREHNGRTFHDTQLWIDDVKPLGPPQSAQWASGEKPSYQTDGDREGQHAPAKPEATANPQAVTVNVEDNGDAIPF